MCNGNKGKTSTNMNLSTSKPTIQAKAVTTMDDGTQSHSSIPLVSRLDRLDSVMKYIERKQKLLGWSGDTSAGGVNRQCMSLDLAVRETYSKGSLLDRIASLENRLFQLSSEMETSNKLCTSKVQTTGDTSSGNGSKREFSCSFPIFNNPNHGYKQEPKVHVNRFKFQEKTQKEQQRLNHPSTLKQQVGKNMPSSNEKTCKSGKKGMPPNWPHLKILGC